MTEDSTRRYRSMPDLLLVEDNPLHLRLVKSMLADIWPPNEVAEVRHAHHVGGALGVDAYRSRAAGLEEALTELENWAIKNQIETGEYAEETFQNALAVQLAGLEEGYLISVDLDYYTETGEWGILLNTFVGNSFYTWSPEKEYYNGVIDTDFKK